MVDLIKLTKVEEDDTATKGYTAKSVKKLTPKARDKQIRLLEKKMKEAAKELDFELAAEYRDQLILLKGEQRKAHE